MGYGKMEGYKSDTVLADMLTEDSMMGTHYHQEWEGMHPHHTDHLGWHERAAPAGLFRQPWSL